MREGYKYWVGTLARIFLGVTFIVAGVGKLLAGSSSFEPFVLPVVLSQSFGEAIYTGLPYLEIIVGGLLIFGVAIRFATILSALLIMGFMASNILQISLGAGTEPCGGCFGVAGGLTAISALAMNGIMALMVVIIFVCKGDRRKRRYAGGESTIAVQSNLCLHPPAN